jgi:hypothetical protein
MNLHDVDNLVAKLDREYRAGQAASAERIKSLEEALTPNGETKAAYIGEFKQGVSLRDQHGNVIEGEAIITWTTVKEIMKAIRKQALPKEADQ